MLQDYNILNIVVNTERDKAVKDEIEYYNILNIVVNTEPESLKFVVVYDYNILNIVVNTERLMMALTQIKDYNILNIVVNTERRRYSFNFYWNYNILNIVVNTEHIRRRIYITINYNILNIVVNTEQESIKNGIRTNYNILNIVVNTELGTSSPVGTKYYNILNIVVNTELRVSIIFTMYYYNILNIVVNTEPTMLCRSVSKYYNILNIVVNTELQQYSHHILNRLSYQECANLATDSMISKAIDVITREIFKSGGKWVSAHLDIENFEMVLNSLDFYNKIRLAVQRALEYGGAFIYINTDDTNLSLPLYLNEKTAKKNKITSLSVIEPWQAAPVQVNSFNPLKENYMEPDLWWVLGASTTVHKTRLIPIVFYSVPDLIKPLYNYLGLPLSFYMKNYVSNADTVRQSISDLVLRFRTKIIKTTAQKIADPQTQARVKYMNATSNNLATLLLAKDEEWIETVTSLSGMDNLLSQMYELMTASTRGIPVTKLLGLSPRGFNANGEYDENNFYDVIDGYAKSVVIPVMEKAAEYVLCFKVGILDEPKYEFAPRKQIRPKEQAEINNLKADYISKLIMSGVVTGKDAIRAISEDNFKFDWIDIEDYKIPENPEVENEIFNQWMDEWKESEHDRDENGMFTGNGSSKSNNDIQAKIDSLNSIDFSKDNKLPNLNQDTLEQYGFEDKPVLLKKNIVEKNKLNHPDITDDMAREIIGNSLYKPEAVLKANKDKPAYHNFITRLKDDKNSIVLLELSDEKENYEIINYHIIKNRQRKQKERRDKNLRENS